MSDGMYGKRAWLYDIIYAPKDYKGEAARIVKILAAHDVEPGVSVLDAAV